MFIRKQQTNTHRQSLKYTALRIKKRRNEKEL